MDATTVGAIFQRHHLALYRTLKRLSGNAALAEDLTQEVFVRILNANTSYDERGEERAWLFTIARRLLLDRQRASQRQPATGSLEAARTASASEGDPGLRIALDQALAQLAPDAREAFVLREIGGLGHAEIARVSESTAAATRNRIHRARLALRELLRPVIHRARRPGARESRP